MRDRFRAGFRIGRNAAMRDAEQWLRENGEHEIADSLRTAYPGITEEWLRADEAVDLAHA